MKRYRRFLVILLLISAFFAPIRASEDPKSTEPIEEEKTPQAGAKTRQSYLKPMLFASVILLGGYIYLNRKEPGRMKLLIETVESYDDGSMKIVLGYKTKGPREPIQKENSAVDIKQGTAIILKDNPDRDERQAVVAIINAETKLQWTLNDQTLEIDGEQLKRKQGGKSI